MDVRDQTFRFWYLNWHDILQLQQWFNALFPKKKTWSTSKEKHIDNNMIKCKLLEVGLEQK